MMLLDSRSENSRYTNSITAHYHRHFATRLIKDIAFHSRTVLRAQVENMSHLDAAVCDQFRATFDKGRRSEPFEVRIRDLTQVSAHVEPLKMNVRLLGATNQACRVL